MSNTSGIPGDGPVFCQQRSGQVNAEQKRPYRSLRSRKDLPGDVTILFGSSAMDIMLKGKKSTVTKKDGSIIGRRKRINFKSNMDLLAIELSNVNVKRPGKLAAQAPCHSFR